MFYLLAINTMLPQTISAHTAIVGLFAYYIGAAILLLLLERRKNKPSKDDQRLFKT